MEKKKITRKGEKGGVGKFFFFLNRFIISTQIFQILGKFFFPPPPQKSEKTPKKGTFNIFGSCKIPQNGLRFTKARQK